MGSARHHDELRSGTNDGFTLVELLIVVVVLGILATVTVLAVRGITQQGKDTACTSDKRLLETAVDTYSAVHQGTISEQALVTGGYLRSASDNYDITVDGVVVPQPSGIYHCA